MSKEYTATPTINKVKVIDAWTQTVRDKMSELELIATWASLTNLGSCRDYCREAIHSLRRYLEIREGK